MKRRKFLKTSSMACLVGAAASASPYADVKMVGQEDEQPSICLNAYSFNRQLKDGEMGLGDLFRFAAETGFEGVDLTAYYIPGYPEVPPDEVLYDIKKMAFRLGLNVIGTGVRNDFALTDPAAREKEIQLVKHWVIAAQKMGATSVRVFSGRTAAEGHPRDEVKSWIIAAMQECADFAREHGVMIAYQNHDDYVVTTSDILDLLTGVHSDWFGLMLDIGSLPVPDPYAEIEKLIPYAITWQIKSHVKTGNGTEPTDFARLMKIIKTHGYRGYLPIEALGPGDPYAKVREIHRNVTENLSLNW
ncbi:MAG: sugar phosphate isomerase/epimerase [Xanthomonadales bacterium]|nr:sugar phosphate isomerase/epimerase [Xanthomonadales bacterium]